MRFRAKLSSFLVLIGICSLLFGCVKVPNTYPDTPVITFKSYTVTKGIDTVGNPDYKLALIISFTDGDGDVGLDASDTAGPFSSTKPTFYNLWTSYYELAPGDSFFRQVTNTWPAGDTLNPVYLVSYNGRIPNVTPPGKEKAIKGDIEYDIDLGSGKFNTGTQSGTNTIRFAFILLDRALHQSNKLYSPPIVLPQ